MVKLDNNKTCCFIGFHEIPKAKAKPVKLALQEEISLAIRDGFTVFVSDFSTNMGLLFAEIVTEAKKNAPQISLDATLPFITWTKSKNKKYRELIQKCSNISILSEQNNSSIFETSNEYMANIGNRLIVLGDNSESSDYLQKGKEIRNIIL